MKKKYQKNTDSSKICLAIASYEPSSPSTNSSILQYSHKAICDDLPTRPAGIVLATNVISLLFLDIGIRSPMSRRQYGIWRGASEEWNRKWTSCGATAGSPDSSQPSQEESLFKWQVSSGKAFSRKVPYESQRLLITSIVTKLLAIEI